MAHQLILGWTVLRSVYSLPHFGEHERDIIVIIAMIYVHVVFVLVHARECLDKLPAAAAAVAASTMRVNNIY